MKKFTSVVLSLLFAATTWAQVTSLSDVDQTKCYTVCTVDRGGWCVSEDLTRFKTTNDVLGTTNITPTDVKQQFAFVTNDNANYYLYSVAAAKFVKSDGTLTSDLDQLEAIEFKPTGNSSYPVFVKFVGNNNGNINIGGSNQMVIDSWSAIDGGNSYMLTEVGEYDYEAAHAIFSTPTITLTVNYGAGQSFVVDLGSIARGEIYTMPAFDPTVITVTGWNNGDAVTEDINLVGTLAEGVKPFKLNNLRFPKEWATTNTAGLMRSAETYEAGEFLIEVPIADSENFKIYSIKQAKWVGAAVSGARQVTFAETAGVFQLLKHSCGAEAIGNAGAASDQQVFFNTRDGGIGTWSADNDAGSHWFMVYDNSNYQANREAAAITIDSSSGSVTGSAFGSALTEAEAKYAAVENIDDNVMEGFGEQKAALKAAIDAAKAARFGAEGVDVAAIIAELTAKSAAINPNVEHYAKGLVIIANADAFVAMGIPSEEGITAWNEAKTVANAVEPTEFTNEAYEAVLAAYNALVATSANTPGEAHVKMASWKVAEDYMCVRHNPSSYSIYRNGSDVNGNKTTWTLKAAEGGFYLFNEYSAKYLRIATGDNQPATPVETTEEASIFVFDIFEAQSARYGIKHVGGAPSVFNTREYLHSNATNTILRWTSGDASSWYLSASDAETAQNEANIGADEDVENALQYFSVELGDAVGQYAAPEEYVSALATAKAITEESSNSDKHAAASSLRAAYAKGGFELNMPAAGKFYRFQNVQSAKYLSSVVSGSRLQMHDESNAAETVFYYDGTYLVAWKDGKVIGKFGGNDQDNSWKTVLKDDEKAGTIIFSAVSAAGKYSIQGSEGRYIYGAADTNGNNVDCGTSAGGNGYYWTIIEVEWLPIVGSEMEIVAVYSPVALNVRDNVVAYSATISGNTVPTTKIDGGIPANTPTLVKFAEEVERDENNGLVYLEINYDAATPMSDVTTPLAGSIYATAAEEGKSYFTTQQHEVTSDDSVETVVDFLSYSSDDGVVPGFVAYVSVATEEVPEDGYFEITGESTTGIVEINAGAVNNDETMIYDLQGRKLSAPVKGINIINGKKVLVK